MEEQQLQKEPKAKDCVLGQHKPNDFGRDYQINVCSFTDFIRSDYDQKARSDTLRSDGLDNCETETECKHEVKVPLEIQWSPGKGRYLVASRDIVAGEVIFQESPLFLSPKPGSEPICLACLKSWQKNGAICQECGGPLCFPSCTGKGHGKLECNLFKWMDFTNTSNIIKKFKELSVILAPLRLYLLMQESQFAREVIGALQSHKENRRVLPIGRIVEERVVTAFQSQLGLDVDSNEIHHLCGVLDTNSFEVSLDGSSRARALFTLASMMNHSCLPNTQRWFVNDNIIVRAASDIPKGTPVTTTYTQTLWGTKARSAHLSACKMFRCTCERCIDPTELGSQMSSVICKKCQSPECLLIPPQHTEKLWKCCKCGEEISCEAIQAMVCASSAVLSRVNTDNVDETLAAFKHLCKLLGAQHYITVELKYAVIQATMNQPLRDTTTDNLIRIMRMSEDLLDLAMKIEPELSRFRGLLLLNRGQAYVELLRRYLRSSPQGNSTTDGERLLNGDINIPENILSEDFLRNMLGQLSECEFILLYDPRLKEVCELTEELRSFLQFLRNDDEANKDIQGGNISESQVRCEHLIGRDTKISVRNTFS